MKIPVIIAHHGKSPSYLKFSLESAAQLNEEVILIGDSSNRDAWHNHWDTTSIVPEKYQEFLKYYFQMSDYSECYEKGFWKRMFLLENWMEINEVSRAIMLDSDVVSFANYTKSVYPLIPETCISALLIPQRQNDFIWMASTHFSYWTLEGIKSFTDFCIDTYSNRNGLLERLKDKFQWHVNNSISGGISEMTLLYLWSQFNNDKVYNFARVTENMTADLSIASSSNYFENEYLMRFGIKRLVFKEEAPYGYNKVLGKEIKFFCLHCQGKYKPMIKILSNRRTRNFYHIVNLILKIGKFITPLKYLVAGYEAI